MAKRRRASRITNAVQPVNTKTGVVDGGEVSGKHCPAVASTAVRISTLAHKIAEGMSRQNAIEYAMREFNIGESQAKKYYRAAINYLLPTDVEEHRKELAMSNIQRLEHIIEEAMKEKQWKIAREAIDTLNKMTGVTDKGVAIGVRTDKDGNNEVMIKFDGE